MDQIDDTFYSEKEIAIEPDLDHRNSTDKLPAPPKTPKRVMMKYRFSAVFPIAFAVASCVLSILVVVAGQGTDMFNGQYLVAVSILFLVSQNLELTRTAQYLPTSSGCFSIRASNYKDRYCGLLLSVSANSMHRVDRQQHR
jgi:hypothetical protein